MCNRTYPHEGLLRVYDSTLNHPAVVTFENHRGLTNRLVELLPLQHHVAPALSTCPAGVFFGMSVPMIPTIGGHWAQGPMSRFSWALCFRKANLKKDPI